MQEIFKAQFPFETLKPVVQVKQVLPEQVKHGNLQVGVHTENPETSVVLV